MSNFIKEQKNDDIIITDIYWDRIYLHVKLTGSRLDQRTYALFIEDETFFYPVRFLAETSEIVLNVTNVYHQKMLDNGKWHLQYLDGEEWRSVIVDLTVCRKMKDLDKVFRYGKFNYAYVWSFLPEVYNNKFRCVFCCTFMMCNRKPQKRKLRIESHSFGEYATKLITDWANRLISVIYTVVSKLTVKNGTRILLMSETRDFGGNLKALDDRLKERGLNSRFKVSYYFKKTLNHSKEKVFFIWLKLAVLTAQQDYIFVDDYVPFFKYIKKHPKTTLVQVWHAGVGFKSVGYARFGLEGSPLPYIASHRKYDYAIVGGEALRDVYAEVFGIDREKCLPYGLMRNDGYLDKDKINKFKDEFFAQYPQLMGKKIILFAPTFRGMGQRDAYYPFDLLDQRKIAEFCGDEYVFLIKMHPFVLEKISINEEYKHCIMDFFDFPDINSLFYITDILITDYSSSIYEFAMLKKPIITFAFDKEEYELIRSVHRTVDHDAPGKVCTDFDDVIKAIREKDFQMEKLLKFAHENISETGERAADQVIDHILLRKNNN